MRIVIMKRALDSIDKTSRWVEDRNTTGSGTRWSDKIFNSIRKIAASNATFQICRSIALARYQYRCFHLGEWVVAYKKVGSEFIIYRFIHGSRLK
jgi:hypothetical protein